MAHDVQRLFTIPHFCLARCPQSIFSLRVASGCDQSSLIVSSSSVPRHVPRADPCHCAVAQAVRPCRSAASTTCVRYKSRCPHAVERNHPRSRSVLSVYAASFLSPSGGHPPNGQSLTPIDVCVYVPRSTVGHNGERSRSDHSRPSRTALPSASILSRICRRPFSAAGCRSLRVSA